MATENRIQTFARLLRRMGVLFTQIASQQSSAHETFSKQELLAVDVLGVRGSCRMGEMAGHLGVVQSAVTPLIDRLEDRNIVRRIRSREDRRVWLVTLTESGLELYADQEKLYRTIAAEMLASLDEADQDTLIALMDRIGARMAVT
ncbi:MAG: MarR family winged helix-turn-helix transcriptional regulator [Rhodothermales bacterium]